MGRGDRRKCKCCLVLFVPIRVTASTSITARPRTAGRPARPPAKPAGSPSLRTVTTSGPVNVARVGPGGHHPAIGARADVPALRYKMSQWHNPLVPQPQRTGAVAEARRYKSS